MIDYEFLLTEYLFFKECIYINDLGSSFSFSVPLRHQGD